MAAKYHKQSASTVRSIRGLYARRAVSQSTLARIFGTCQSNVSQIVNRVTWRDR